MDKEENIHKGHRKRVKEEFLEADTSLEYFSDIRSLELLLFYAFAQKDTNPLAHALLDRFGSLYSVLSASAEQLMEIDGIGENAAILIRLVSELSNKSIAEEKRRNKKNISSSSEAGEYICSFFNNCTEEKFMMVCLDSMHNIIKTEKISSGNVNSVSVDKRRVAQTALQHNAVSVIFAHNHPGGNLLPSKEDISLTSSLKEALENIGITVVDHIIVANGNYYSFADEDLI